MRFASITTAALAATITTALAFPHGNEARQEAVAVRQEAVAVNKRQESVAVRQEAVAV